MKHDNNPLRVRPRFDLPRARRRKMRRVVVWICAIYGGALTLAIAAAVFLTAGR